MAEQRSGHEMNDVVGRAVEDMDRQFPNPRLVCTVCGFEATGDWGSLRTGWRKCCGYTMRLVTGREDTK